MLSVLHTLFCGHRHVRVPPRSPYQATGRALIGSPRTHFVHLRHLACLSFGSMFYSIYATIAAFLNKLVRSVYLLTSVISLLLYFHLDPLFTVLSPQSDRWGLACSGESCRRIGCGVPYVIGPRRPYHSGHDERLRVDLRRSWKESPSLAQSVRLLGVCPFTTTVNSPHHILPFLQPPKFTTLSHGKAINRVM